MHGADAVPVQDVCVLHRAQNLSRQLRQEARGKLFAQPLFFFFLNLFFKTKNSSSMETQLLQGIGLNPP